jgi:RND family efflux transporter MFP subunit
MSRLLPSAFLLALGTALFAGCGPKPTGAALDTTVKVTYAEAIERENVDYEEYTGRTVAVKSVDIRPQVTARVEKVLFKDGDMVRGKSGGKKGQQLYLLDDRTFKADLAQAESATKSAQARVDQYNADLTRARRLKLGDAISREDFDKTTANRDEAAATLLANRAKADAARINLGYTHIDSDIDGMISKTFVTEGNLATANTTLLTNIVSIDPIYAEFDVDERTVLRIGKLIHEGKFKSYTEAKIPALVGTQIDKDYPHKGVINFVDNQLNQGTGTLLVRASVPNPDRILRPGLFIRVRLSMGQKYKAVLVAEQSLVSDQDRKFVYVLGTDDTVDARPVVVGGHSGGLRVIEKGLREGDRVILTGLQRLRPGAKVEAKKVEMPSNPN